MDLKSYRWIVVNSSGGKDSQTALRQIVLAADAAGVSRNRIVVSHQCLGKVEWQGTLDLVKEQAAAYGLRVEVSRYRNAQGAELGLLDYVRARRKWPSSTTRFCASEFKRSPGARTVTKLHREAPGRILNVYGFRSEESPARAKKIPFGRNPRLSNQSRIVEDYLPIFSWTQAQVWADIKASGVAHHKAYDLGMPRLSCCFCIFAPKAALLVAGKANPELLDEYVQLEREIGHDFQNGKPIADIQAAIAAGETAGSMDGNWNM